MVQHRDIDCAILDLDIDRRMPLPIADLLAFADVPFVYLTKGAFTAVPSRHRHRPVVESNGALRRMDPRPSEGTLTMRFPLLKTYDTWMGRCIDEMSREELVGALKWAARLVQTTAREAYRHPDVDVTVSPSATVVGRTFSWAFIPAGQLWSGEDRAAIQERLNKFAARCGLDGAVVRFEMDRLEVEVPRRLQVEQIIALQDWLATEKDALDVSQVP